MKKKNSGGCLRKMGAGDLGKDPEQKQRDR